MGLFKTYFHPYQGTVLTNANCVFIHTISGIDSNPGTRESPVQTVTKAYTLGKPYGLLSGMSTENPSGSMILLGDNSQSGIVGNITANSTAGVYALANIVVTGNVQGISNNTGFYKKIICNQIQPGLLGTYAPLFEDIFTNMFLLQGKIVIYKTGNITCLNARNYVGTDYTQSKFISFIFVDSIDLYNYVSRSVISRYPVFQYCLFRKLTQWKWNGATITINWDTNPLNSTAYTDEPLLDRVYNSLLFYANSMTDGTDKTYFQAILATKETMFYKDANGQTNKVVDDVLYPIFNKYNGTTPIDYSLKLATNNVALTMSDIGGYVGAYKANLNHVQFGTILHVNTDGSDDTVTTPDLLVSEGLNQFYASDTSLQLRNRIRTTVLEFPRGKVFDGAQSMLISGIESRLHFGKHQPMVTTGANPTIPVETIEVIPYDAIPADNSVAQANNLSGKSAFPRFSIMFNGLAEMWYKNNAPLLFNQLGSLYTGNGTISNTAGSNTVTGVNTLFTTYLVPGDLITVGGQTVKVLSIDSATSLTVDTPITNANTNAAYTVGIYVDKSLTEYGDWAVTNADIEDYSLSFKITVAGVSKRNIPVKFCKLELNLNYAEE